VDMGKLREVEKPVSSRRPGPVPSQVARGRRSSTHFWILLGGWGGAWG
jgi:hypothetical protein